MSAASVVYLEDYAESDVFQLQPFIVALHQQACMQQVLRFFDVLQKLWIAGRTRLNS